MYQSKNLEYYLDSRIYSSEDVQKRIEKTKKEFSNKKVEANVYLNTFGVYVITFKFENKNTYLNKIKIGIGRKFQKTLLLDSGNKSRLEQYYGKNRYGQYESMGTYRPY